MAQMAPKLVSIIIPTMNEEESLGSVIMELQRAFSESLYAHEVVVVDTMSEDRTVQIAKEMGGRVIREDRRGYGRAYMTGFAEARGDFIATLDADFTYPGYIIPAMVSTLEEEGLDFISCERLTTISGESMEASHRLGNAGLNLAIRLLHGIQLRDSQSGMWVFRRDALERLELTSLGMPFSEEIKLEAIQEGLRFREFPIQYRPRIGEAKLRSISDGWANFRYLFHRRLRKA